MQYTEEQLIEAFEKLPEEIQTAISDAETEKKITIIGQRHNLHVDQIGDLANETGLVMLGLEHPDKFVSNLAQKLGLTTNEAELITQEINKEVLIDVRETIKKMAEGNREKVDQTQPKPAGDQIFEQKVSKIFSLSNNPGNASIGAPKPWEEDPYLEKP